MFKKSSEFSYVKRDSIEKREKHGKEKRLRKSLMRFWRDNDEIIDKI